MILYVVAVAFIQTLLHGVHRDRLLAFGVAVALIVGATFTGQPVLLTGLVLAALVAVLVVQHERYVRDQARFSGGS